MLTLCLVRLTENSILRKLGKTSFSNNRTDRDLFAVGLILNIIGGGQGYKNTAQHLSCAVK